MKLEEIKQFVNNVDGWLTDREGEYLYQLAKNCTGRGVIVEIGSWKGKSTIWLGCGSKNGNKVSVYAVDHHQGSPEHYLWYGNKPIWTFDEFQKNIRIARVDDIVVPIVKKSAEAARDFNQSVELIFIDGAHEYLSVKQDFELWFPKLIDGGIMVFHDTGGWAPWPGPIRVVRKKIYGSGNFKNIRIVDSMTIAEKTNTVQGRDLIRNKLMIIFSYYWEFYDRGKLKLVNFYHQLYSSQKN